MKSFLLSATLFAAALAAPRPPKWNSFDSKTRVAPRPKASFHMDPSYQMMAAATADNITTGAGQITAPFENIWASLSNDEAASVIAFLHDQKELNLTAAINATSFDNQIAVVDSLYPSKKDAMSYLSSETGKPERWAKARIMFGAPADAYVEEFCVGPLPVSEKTTYKSADYFSTKGSAKQPSYANDDDNLYEFIYSVTKPMDEVIRGLINQTVVGDPDVDTAEVFGIDPLWQEHGRIINWLGFWTYPSEELADGLTLLPQGLYFKADVTGRDPAGWSVKAWYWADKFYSSTEGFKAAFYAGELEQQVLNTEYTIDGVSTLSTNRPDLPSLYMDDLPAPLPVAPGGSRYSVDEEKSFVHWQDFTFYYTFSRDTGIRLFDIKYKGDTIIYELGLEEAIAHYAGNDPVTSGIGYLDTYYGFGPYTFQLVAGYDCPAYASFHNTTFHASETSRTHRDSICMFEFDTGHPIQHHTTQDYVSSTRNIQFVLRTISTVGNYDYSQEMVFSQDGSIEVKVRASGYISSAFHGHNDEYGYRIDKGRSGAMHDHTLTYKADLDIGGVKNSMAVDTIVPVEKTYPWSDGIAHGTMMFKKEYIENEDEGKINWAPNMASFYSVVNKDDLNPYGEARGYRIMPGHGATHLTIQDSYNLQKAQGFATHNLYVTKHHDQERQAAHAYNNYDVYNPIIDFSKYFNSESLIQEDLVTWFVLGMHHVPHTGDLPNTVFTTAQSSMIIAPHNYLLRDPSRLSRQQVRIAYSASALGEDETSSTSALGADDGTTEPAPEGDSAAGKSQVETFGSTPATGFIQLTVPDLTTYKGDVAIRKFPYDPTNPYDETESID